MNGLHYDYWYEVIRPGKIMRPMEHLKKECYYFSEEWQKELDVLAIGVAGRELDWDGNKVHNGCVSSKELKFVIVYKYKSVILDNWELEDYIENRTNNGYKWFRLGE